LNSTDLLRGDLSLKTILPILFLLVLFPPNASALSLDDKVQLVIEVYELASKECAPDSKQRGLDFALAEVGEIFFNTSVLSGDKDTSCSTCHLDSEFLTDGLELSVGVGGEGEGLDRVNSQGIIVPRNAFTLFGRAHSEFTTFFWDGKIQEQDGLLYSPIGEAYSMGFNSPLSVAAVLPVLARDEFLGKMAIYGNSKNLDSVNGSHYQDKVPAINRILKDLLTNTKDPDVINLRAKLAALGKESLDLPLVGNALASFIRRLTSECTNTRWSDYLKGNRSALTDEEKKGAISFYGKGRCASCHGGNFFSDFDFHSIGVPQGEFGTHINKQDIGRASVTFNLKDRYKFRTPPLLYVSKTAPYGHNGAFKTLEDVVLFHINPIPYFVSNGWTSKNEIFSYGSILSTRSETLGYIELNETEMAQVISFLEAL
jgi:cytochrome c peroxidase